MSPGQVGCRFFEPQPAADQISKLVEVNLNNFLTTLCYVGDMCLPRLPFQLVSWWCRATGQTRRFLNTLEKANFNWAEDVPAEGH